MVSLLLAVTLMQSVEQGRVDQCAGPDHACRPDDKLSEETTKGETHRLCADIQKHLVGESGVFSVEHLLSSENVGSVGADDSDVAHDGDADVFFDVEWTWVQAHGVTTDGDIPCGEQIFKGLSDWERDQLDDNAGDVEGGV